MAPLDDAPKLDRATLIHGIYRALLNTGRTYAAFEDGQIAPLIDRLRDRGEILDPMSGYGSLMRYCAYSTHPLRSYCMEANEPAHFWQLLMHPRHSKAWIELADRILACKSAWPRSGMAATTSDDWFPPESQRILLKLWEVCLRETGKCPFRRGPSCEYLAIAFLLPFCGRLAAMVQGSVVTHVKRGGICVYRGWKVDFEKYVRRLRANLAKQVQLSKRTTHTIVLGDCLDAKLPLKRFSAMITSPPYPNSRDYSSMFLPELDFIRLLKDRGFLGTLPSQARLIGSPIVSPSEGCPKRTVNDVMSGSAREFLHGLEKHKGTKNTVYDIEVYYLPYFSNYFVAIEQAYCHLSSALSDDFEGYIIVVNNTARKTVVPVAAAIVETWKRLGFSASIEDEFSRELSHVGGLNPRVKGLSARHMEYTVKVWR